MFALACLNEVQLNKIIVLQYYSQNKSYPVPYSWRFLRRGQRGWWRPWPSCSLGTQHFLTIFYSRLSHEIIFFIASKYYFLFVLHLRLFFRNDSSQNLDFYSRLIQMCHCNSPIGAKTETPRKNKTF
jgi:hypothetical protein